MSRSLPRKRFGLAAAAGSRLPSGARRRGGPILLAACLAWIAATGQAQTAAPAAPKPAPTKPAPMVGLGARPATTPAPRPPVKKVWTQADLEALRSMPGAHINLVDPTGQDDSGTYIPETAGPRRADPEVLQRYDELKVEADERIAALQRERLASVNPLLRGTVRDAAGQPVAPRAVADIDADIARWQGRKAAADDGKRRTLQAAGQRLDVETPAPE